MQSQLTITTKRNQLVQFLTKELGSVAEVKLFSSTLKSLELCDLTNDEEFMTVTNDGGAILGTLLTWYSLGFMSKLLEIKHNIKGK